MCWKYPTLPEPPCYSGTKEWGTQKRFFQRATYGAWSFLPASDFPRRTRLLKGSSREGPGPGAYRQEAPLPAETAQTLNFGKYESQRPPCRCCRLLRTKSSCPNQSPNLFSPDFPSWEQGVDLWKEFVSFLVANPISGEVNARQDIMGNTACFADGRKCSVEVSQRFRFITLTPKASSGTRYTSPEKCNRINHAFDIYRR